ncbi:helix-turn-helix domain-containing protein [Nocardioides zeae]|uniref:Helix-turn-helix domain-containing protein n=1 Tax=Nocardioides imazamoxiresistens TaxID=3231893 RepID=A0ABU3PWR0_9ACTN|nr:helix-turn-helix domain-containing protein [Nocardioides zeae]MDT9593666.1 helix-turn-helix domain-containing protein [Nocardioides zeae]
MSSNARTGTKGVPRAEREEQILDAAQRAFARVGYAAASVPEIARAAGITKPLVYSYFGSKEGLYAACADAAGRVVVADVERSAALGAVGVERGLLTVAGLAEALDGRPHLWLVLFDRTVPPGSPAAEAARRHTDRLGALAVEGVGEMLRLAGDTDPADLEVMTRIWVGMLDTVMRWWAEHPDEPGPAVLARAERVAGALFTGVGGSTP